MLRFVVLDDDYIGDDFIGQYSVAFECLQPGYRNVPLLGLAGDPLAHTSLFVHVAVTNRRGGGKAQRRGLSVRRVGRRGREYVTLRHAGIKAVDDTFKLASAALKEATDLREEAQVRDHLAFIAAEMFYSQAFSEACRTGASCDCGRAESPQIRCRSVCIFRRRRYDIWANWSRIRLYLRIIEHL